jgi:hypothetical protein
MLAAPYESYDSLWSPSPSSLPSLPSIFEETMPCDDEPFDGAANAIDEASLHASGLFDDCPINHCDGPQAKKARRAPRGQPKRPSAPTKSWSCPHPGCNKVLLGPNNHNVNKHVLKMHPDSPAILRCSMCADFRTMKRDELEKHARSCLGRTAPVPLLPMGTPVITLPTYAVIAEASPEERRGTEPLENRHGSTSEEAKYGSEEKMQGEEKEAVEGTSVLPASQLRTLTFEEIDLAIEPYITWRGQVGSTEHERTVKKAIIDTPVKRTKLRGVLRRYFSTAATLVPYLFAGELDVRLLVDVEVVQSLFQHQETHRLRGRASLEFDTPNDDEITAGVVQAAGVGSAAKYELRNELRKIIVFVISRQSQLAGRLLFPEQHPAYHLVTASARYVGQRRKREQRDRMRFGDDSRIMTGDEQADVLTECREQLGRLMGLERRLTTAEEHTFTDHLVVALLLLLLGPRQEVLAHTTTMNLKPPRSLGNPRDTYYLQVSGQFLKDGPFSGAVPAVLTAAMTYYIQRVRPLTVMGPMFVGPNGLARVDFSNSTRRVTMSVLGRPITSHRLRHSQVTDELQRAEVTPEVRRDMAAHRGHSVQVQEAHYNLHRLERTQAMMQGELLRRVDAVRERRNATVSNVS